MTKKFQNSFSARTARAARGFTLIEIMIALGIMGTAIAAVLYYQGKAEGSQKALATVQDTTSLASKIKAMYGPQNSYTSVSVDDFKKMGIIPAGFTHTTGVLKDAYGNAMEITGGASSFTISIGGSTGPLQREECSAIATGIRGNAVAIQVGDAAVGAAGIATATAGSTYKATNGDLDASLLATGCSTVNPKIVMQFR